MRNACAESEFKRSLRSYALWVISAWITAGIASAAMQGDSFYRRGYPEKITLDAAVADYNEVHHHDAVACQYPELRTEEVILALNQLLKKSKSHSPEYRALASLLTIVKKGSLPVGSMLTFQYAEGNRSPYWTKWDKLSANFSLILWCGLNQNPPGESEYNENASIFGYVIRTTPRVDLQFQ